MTVLSWIVMDSWLRTVLMENGVEYGMSEFLTIISCSWHEWLVTFCIINIIMFGYGICCNGRLRSLFISSLSVIGR